ncbi:hypothetical protein [Massilia rubra]|uniref:Uncharacterized protein n=1 Tax=Massilia rubra TaxID=2607910 RepID=A0ABX0LNW5_9BURK|nr:hypothetical protein [Massilia rubra]NHZ36389.1 hypothetical protein [Massilia rubra]
MNVIPNYRTAALAGAWCAIGMVSIEAWQDLHAQSVIAGNVGFLGAAAVFFFVPVFFFVIGRDTQFTRTWFLGRHEAQAHAKVVKRMLVWFFSASVVGVMLSLAQAVVAMLVS